MKFFATLAPLACLISLVVADYASVSSGIDDVNAKLTTLNNRLQGTDGTDYFADLAIDGDAKNLVNSLNTATRAFSNSETFTEAQADPLIAKLTTSTVTTTALVDRIIKIKPGFQKTLVIGIVQGDIRSLDTAVTSFADAAVSKTPESRQEQAKAIRTSVTGDIARAKAAYA